MAQGPSDTILVAIRITLRIREFEIRIIRIGGGLFSVSAFLLKHVSFVQDSAGNSKASSSAAKNCLIIVLKLPELLS